MHIRLPGAVLLAGASALLGLGLGLGIPAAASNPGTNSHGTTQGQHAPFPHMDHVFVIMMENTPYSTLLTPSNPNTTYIQSIAKTYGLEADYYGVTHTSLPNYVAATSGSTWGSNNDDEAQATAGDFAHTSLFDQLGGAHVSWKAYMESIPSVGYTGNYGDCTAHTGAADPDCTATYTHTGKLKNDHGTALYVRKHNPAMQYPDIFGTALAKNVVPLTQLSSDLAHNTVPQFVWISPNLCNDMHGGVSGKCTYPTDTTPATPAAVTLFQDGNQFLQTWVGRITSSKAWTGNSAIFVTWDEGGYENLTPYGPKDNSGCCDSPVLPTSQATPATGTGGDLAGGTLYGGGHVPMIVIARHGARGATDTAPANHYSLLQTIEANWGLPYLGDASDTLNVTNLAPLLK